MVTRALWLSLVLGSGLFACESPRVEAPLLELGAVTPAVWAPGTRVAVEAEGLPLGHQGVLQLTGTLHRPGEADRAIDETLPVRATAAGRAETHVERRWLDGLGGRGTFEGQLVLRFEGEGDASIFGRRDEVRLDLEPAALSTAFREDPAPAIERMARYGVHLEPPVVDAPDEADDRDEDEDSDEDEPDAPGRVAATSGPAARAGLRPGDVIVAAGGVRIRSWGDLRVAPDDERLALRFRRAGLRGEREVFVTAPVGGEPVLSTAPWLPWVVAAFLLALFGVPLQLVRRHLHTLRRHWSRAESSPLRMVALASVGAVAILALWPLGPLARAALVLAAGVGASPTLAGGWRHLPAAAFVLAAPTLVGTGSLAPETWPILRAPLLVPLAIVAIVPLVHLEGARWRRAPRAVAFAAIAAASAAEPSRPLAALLPFALAIVGSFFVVPDRASGRARIALVLSATALSLGVLLFGHMHLELPPARASLEAMVPALAAVALLVVAGAASTRAHVRAPFGL
ncbi:MAG: hypothetical protein JJ863_14645 [Deltaproteobacteria bacterium]|nr:hypothetical protein [Deltaproteobacteria bacterium]